MNDTFKLLTQCQKGQSHRETVVTIDWDGITEQQLKTIARAHFIHVLQTQWKFEEKKVPEKVTVRAAEMVHAEIFVPREYTPRKKMSPFELLMKDLSPDDLAELIANL